MDWKQTMEQAIAHITHVERENARLIVQHETNVRAFDSMKVSMNSVIDKLESDNRELKETIEHLKERKEHYKKLATEAHRNSGDDLADQFDQDERDRLAAEQEDVMGDHHKRVDARHLAERLERLEKKVTDIDGGTAMLVGHLQTRVENMDKVLKQLTDNRV